MKNASVCELSSYEGSDVAVIRLKEKMEVLSSAVLNGGDSVTSCLFIMEVPKNYMCDDPVEHAEKVRRGLGLPPDSVGFMTAAEVRYVFNTKLTEYSGASAFAAVTAGLSNQVIAGDILEDWDRRSKLSLERSKALHAGTINIVGILSIPMTQAAKVNIIIAMTEAKTAALNSLGYKETGTTSDAIAIVSPIGSPKEEYAGTGTSIGIAMARSVKECVRTALIRRGDDSHGTYLDMLAEAGVSRDELLDYISMEISLNYEGRERLSEEMCTLESNMELSLLIQCAIIAEYLGKNGLLFGVDKERYFIDPEVGRMAVSLSERIVETVCGQIGIKPICRYNQHDLHTRAKMGPFLSEAISGLAGGLAERIPIRSSNKEVLE